MTLQEVIEAFEYKISGGSEYQWHCFGDHARFLDFETEYGNGSVIFDSVDQTVYQAEVWVRELGDSKSRPYRWSNPDYFDAYLKEATERNVKYRVAYDDVEFIDLEQAEDFFEKAKAIMNGIEFDKRIVVPLDLPDSLMLELFKEAHKRDITLNQLVDKILQNLVDTYE